MHLDRRSVLAVLGTGIPLVAARATTDAPASASAAPSLRFVPFEEAVRTAFRGVSTDGTRRVAVGCSDLVRAGVQRCVNSRPFAGFPAGGLRIVRTVSEPGPVVSGVRLLVTFVDVAVTGGRNSGPSRPLDFAALPPAAELTSASHCSRPL